MSTIELPSLDFECPKCGTTRSEIYEGYVSPDSPWLEEEREARCYCGSALREVNVNCYQAKCDGCGHVQDDYGDYNSIGPTADDMWECLPDWHHTQHGDFCEECGPQGDDE